MVISFLVAVYFSFFHARTGLPPISDWLQLLLTIGITTAGWLAVTYLTRPVDQDPLVNFCRQIRPGGPGWARIYALLGKEETSVAVAWQVPQGILCMVLGCTAIYAALFSTGYLIYGRYALGITLGAVAVVASVLLAYSWKKLIRQS
jgi:MFS family permease